MKPLFPLAMLAVLISTPALADNSYQPPQALVAPSAFKGVHGLAVDHQGRLLAGSVVSASMYQVDIDSGEVTTFIGPPEGQADDIAIGPNGEMAWTGFYLGKVLYREKDDAPIRVLAEGLPGINSIAFNQETGKLYASQVFLGDALWEVDVSGASEPRAIGKDLGGFNGFEVGRDGWLYGPLWFKGQVVKINPADGAMQTVAEGFDTPAAVNFDSEGNLYVLDTRAGTLNRVDVSTGQTNVVATLDSSLDNLAIDKDDRIFVSNMADNSIELVDPSSGEARVITKGELAVPAGLTISEDGKTLYIADIFAFRAVDTDTGEVTDIRRAHGSDIEYPSAVSMGRTRFLLTSASTGTLQAIDMETRETSAMVHGFNAPSSAVELEDGTIVVSELGSGKLIKVTGDALDKRAGLVEGLQGVVQMIVGADGKIYLTEAAGFLTRVDPKNGKIERLIEDLAMPEGLAQLSNGDIVVAETAAKRLSVIDLDGGEREVLAKNLPIGLPAGPGMPPSGITTGVAVDADGVIYFGSDIDNGLYKIEPVIVEPDRAIAEKPE
ncbi:SMP-30/gluconolactonase/LRE family protein [Halopseudomonas nanhaiensis]|uniref:Vgb family protein n=1 Tax=Halopseudomonas nanhaiensis TaxID=2830842 RepID=UPI001CBD3879|nr:hypothetical protein [Halopseudomonas nanhaiensis]UAW99482.1 SMP-30/gluconolactonase/LRE family protein [Halopseudomonas nanhaiensis]